MKNIKRIYVVVVLVIVILLIAYVVVRWTRVKTSYGDYISEDDTVPNTPATGWDEDNLEHREVMIDGEQYDVFINQ